MEPTVQDFIDGLLQQPIADEPTLLDRHKAHVQQQEVEANYLIGGLAIQCPPGVYHPEVGSSSLFLLSHLLRRSYPVEPDILEVGVGCGAVLLPLARQIGAGRFCGTDISTLAISTFQENARRNSIVADASVSELFANVSNQLFDAIIFNPPLFDRVPDADAEDALFCDPGGRLLRRFLSRAAAHVKPSGQIYIVLSNIGNVSPLYESGLPYTWIAVEGSFNGSPEVRAIACITPGSRQTAGAD